MPAERDDNEVFRNKISRSARIVVKVGSSLLTREPETFNRVVKDIYELRRASKSVVIVSSGAISLGMQRVGVKERPKVIPELQALGRRGPIDSDAQVARSGACNCRSRNCCSRTRTWRIAAAI